MVKFTKFTKDQFQILDCMAKGKPYNLPPMTRRAFLRWQFIKPNGEIPPPRLKRTTQAPARLYVVTPLGLEEIAKYDGPVSPFHEHYPKIVFGRAGRTGE